MKFLTIALAVSGVASAASLGAQTLPTRSGVVLQSTQRGTDCSYARTTNSVGDIIFGRANLATNCTDVYSREDGAWYQVGRGRDNNSIYERRVRDRNGNLIIQRARRNPNGTFTIFSTRAATANDKQWKQVMKERQKAYKQNEKAEDKLMKERLKAGTITKAQYDAWKRADKQQDKYDKTQMKADAKIYKGNK